VSEIEGVLFRMKRSLAIAFTLASGMVLSAAAQTAAPATAAPAATAPVGPAKVAVIAFQAAVAQTNEFQRNYADLQKKFDPKRQQLSTLNTEIENLTKQLQTQNASLSDAERASRAGAIDIKKKQLQRDSEDAQNDFQSDMQDMFKGVASKVYDVLTDYAQKQGYTLVLDASQEQNPVLFAVESVNITKPVLDAYNVKSGVPAPPPQPAAAAPGPRPSTTPRPATGAPARPATTTPRSTTTH
jgi:outer membrane protein